MPSQFQTIRRLESRNTGGSCLHSPLSENFGEAHLQTLLRAKQIEDDDEDEDENDNFALAQY